MSSRVIRGKRPGTPQNARLESHSVEPLAFTPGAAAADRLHLEGRIRELESALVHQVEQARQTAYREGEAAGAARAQAAFDTVIQQLSRTIADVAGYRARFRRDSEQEMLKLSLAVARKVLHRELNMDPHALLGVIKAVIETLNVSEIYKVRIAPADAAALQRELTRIGLPEQVEVIGDSTLPRGSVLFDTVRGLVDAGIHTQLAEIERGFADRLGAA